MPIVSLLVCWKLTIVQGGFPYGQPTTVTITQCQQINNHKIWPPKFNSRAKLTIKVTHLLQVATSLVKSFRVMLTKD